MKNLYHYCIPLFCCTVFLSQSLSAQFSIGLRTAGLTEDLNFKKSTSGEIEQSYGYLFGASINLKPNERWSIALEPSIATIHTDYNLSVSSAVGTLKTPFNRAQWNVILPVHLRVYLGRSLYVFGGPRGVLELEDIWKEGSSTLEYDQADDHFVYGGQIGVGLVLGNITLDIRSNFYIDDEKSILLGSQMYQEEVATDVFVLSFSYRLFQL